jgi:sterol desaturase/sphingolipid hydroxylase (fatty acid hydroxylase superfamily)
MTAPDATTEIALRLGTFLALFAAFAVWEAVAPAWARRLPRGRRWATNLALVALGTAALRLVALVLPLLAIGAAVDAQAQGWGLFNALAWPAAVEGIAAVLVFDLCIWVQHLVSHKVPLFWRFHRVHHADRDMDVTTAVRFHPVEILASMGVKIGLVYLLGPSPWAVLAFEVLLSGTALFAHAALRLPVRAERVLRLVLVTPGMHRVHHSDRREEHDSNYGFCLSVWDRLFGTLRGERRGETGLQWPAGPERLGWSLWLPFR